LQRERLRPEPQSALCRLDADLSAASRRVESAKGLHRERVQQLVLRQLLRLALDQVFR
jgi:hypothetical protein